MAKKSLEVTLAEIEKKFGKGTVATASEAKSLKYVRIPTGIFALDVAVGGGYGLPRGRASLLIGEKSSGKTTVCMKTTATWQRYCRMCNTEIAQRYEIDKLTGEVKKDLGKRCSCGANVPCKVAYIDGEGTYDPIWGEALGVDNDALLLVQPDYAEAGIDITEALIRSGEIDLAIVDSIAAFVPSAEIEASSEDEFMGIHARLINKFCRAITAGFNSLGMETVNKPHVILINQFRQKIGTMFGNPNTITGGKGQEFLASITIEMRAPSKIGENGALNPKQDGYENKVVEIVGIENNFEITKNKTYPPFKRGTFRVFNQETHNDKLDVLKGEVNNEEQVISKAEYYGLVTKSGSWYYFGEEKLGQGLPTATATLMKNPALFEQLKVQVLEKIRVQNGL